MNRRYIIIGLAVVAILAFATAAWAQTANPVTDPLLQDMVNACGQVMNGLDVPGWHLEMHQQMAQWMLENNYNCPMHSGQYNPGGAPSPAPQSF